MGNNNEGYHHLTRGTKMDSNTSEKRRHFRLAARLPMDVLMPASSNDRVLRRISTNVSAGGVYFQAHTDDGVSPGQQINLRISVPPAVGRMPWPGTIEGEARVLRVEPLTNANDRLGVACIFTQPLQFA
jgi:hypothetical protein